MVASNETVVGWIPECKGRGTLGILISCIATLGVCVWTALHLNVLPIGPHFEPASVFVGKCVWALTTLIAPEIVLAIALHQFLVARYYRDKMGLKQLVTAFYAIMGGFARGEGSQPLVTIPFRDLLKETIIRKVLAFPIEGIADKSKANLIGKLLACVQASWLLVQCLGRKLQGLPITLLELNTVVHVLTAIFMYGLWWNKPADVYQPSVIITVESLHEPRPERDVYPGGERTRMEELNYEREIFDDIGGGNSREVDLRIVAVRNELREWDEKHGQMGEPDEAMGGSDEIQSPNESIEDPDEIVGLDEIRVEGPDEIQRPTKVPFNRMAATVVSASRSSFKERDRLRDELQSLVERGREDWLRNPFASFFGSLVGNQIIMIGSRCDDISPGLRQWRKRHGIFLLAFSSAAGLVYCGIHATKWNSVFPTQLEQLLWRVSCCVGAVGIFPLLALSATFKRENALEDQELSAVRGIERPTFTFKTQGSARMAAWLLSGLVFIGARTYLVVESFISIRALPKGAYDTVSWLDGWPHI
ncbi:MAG: hypothetical protein M1840_002044 [Geoglossum simile]|nr:MAG: hypothetical protein M1840_002044 [Geoglossum simile]